MEVPGSSFGTSASAELRSDEFAALLQRLNATLLVTTYQTGSLIAVRAAGERLSLLRRRFDRAMGVGVHDARLALGTSNRIWFFKRLARSPYRPRDGYEHDVCYCPRRSHVTGDIRIHELAWAGTELWLVNTRFSCLCTLDEQHSFVPRWWPPFITRLAADDRCHLNGLAVVADRVHYVTAVGASDDAQGWRHRRLDGGVVLNVPNGEVVAHDLCMPHSPRIAAGKLYVLNSGHGQLEIIDTNRGTRDAICRLPGYARGLSIIDGVAFVGLSRMRPSRTFANLPIDASAESHVCGVHAVDLASGTVVARLDLSPRVQEIFDVNVLPEARFATIVGCEQKTVNRCLDWPEVADHEPRAS